jgi:hypothetical protein
VSRGASSACAAFVVLPVFSWLPRVFRLCCVLPLLGLVMFFHSAESPTCFPIPLLADLFRVRFFFVYRFSLTSNQSSSSLIFFVYLGLINFVPRVLLALPASEMCSLKGFSFFLFFCGSTVCFSRVITLCHRDLRLGVLSTGICFQVAYYCTD